MPSPAARFGLWRPGVLGATGSCRRPLLGPAAGPLCCGQGAAPPGIPVLRRAVGGVRSSAAAQSESGGHRYSGGLLELSLSRAGLLRARDCDGGRVRQLPSVVGADGPVGGAVGGRGQRRLRSSSRLVWASVFGRPGWGRLDYMCEVELVRPGAPAELVDRTRPHGVFGAVGQAFDGEPDEGCPGLRVLGSPQPLPLFCRPSI